MNCNKIANARARMPLPTARYSLALAVVNDTIYAIGGSTGLYQNTSAQNDRYIPFRDGVVPWSFPTALVVVISIIVAVSTGAGLLIYVKKRRGRLTSD